jgi:mannosyltransferase OCH1-like enzyme
LTVPFHQNYTETIPKIIHRVFSHPLPQYAMDAKDSCLKKNPLSDGWVHYFWQEEDIDDFLRHKYPGFLSLYRNYPYAEQRKHLFRYLILYEYGGIFLDDHIVCEESLEPLIHQPAWLVKTSFFGFSDDILLTSPNHPFYFLLMNDLPTRTQKYWTVFFTTGSGFLNWHSSRYLSVPHEADHMMYILFIHLDGTGRYFRSNLPDASQGILTFTRIFICGIVITAIALYVRRKTKVQ